MHITAFKDCMHAFCLLYIGTGKSTVGAHLAYVFAKLNREIKAISKSKKNRCVIYCGSFNVSMDFVASMCCVSRINESIGGTK